MKRSITFHGKTIEFNYALNKSLQKVFNEILQPKNKYQALVDEFILNACEQYTPFDTGRLIKSSRELSRIGEGELIWNAKSNTGFNYTRTQWYAIWGQYNYSNNESGLRGPRWALRAINDHDMEALELLRSEILKDARLR